MRERKEPLARLLTEEMGKLIAEARGEVDLAASILSYYAEHGPGFAANEPLDVEEGEAYLVDEPLGVLLGVMPWNFPYYQVVRFAGPNLVLGNTVLVKHAGLCPQSALALETVFRDAGLPGHVHQPVREPRRDLARHRQPGRPGSVADRQRAGGCPGRRAGRTQHEAEPAGTGRQRRLHRPGRREPGAHDRRRGGRPDGEHRTELRGVEAVHRPRRGLRRLRRRNAPRVRSAGARRPGGRGDHPGPPLVGAGGRRPGQTDRRDGGAGSRARHRRPPDRPPGRLRRADDPHRRQARDARLRGGALRSRRRDPPGGRRGRGGRPRQRQPVRSGRFRLLRGRGTRPPGRRAGGDRHGLGQPPDLHAARPALRRHQAFRLRTRALRTRHAGVRQPQAGARPAPDAELGGIAG